MMEKGKETNGDECRKRNRQSYQTIKNCCVSRVVFSHFIFVVSFSLENGYVSYGNVHVFSSFLFGRVMGNGTSLVVENQLLEALHLEIKKDAKERKNHGGSSCSDEEEDEDEEEEDDENDGTETQQTTVKLEDRRDLLLYQKIDHLLSKFSLDNAFRDDVIMTDLLDVDDAIHQAFLTGRTPLILDTSPDDKLSTYLSYQPNVVLLEVDDLYQLPPIMSPSY